MVSKVKEGGVIKKQLLLLLIVSLVPVTCYAQDLDGGVRSFLNGVLYILYFFTALSAYNLFRFLENRQSKSRTTAIIISAVIVLIGSAVLFTSSPLPHYAESKLAQEDARKQRNVGFTLLLPNLLIVLVAPWPKSGRSYEVLIGRLDNDQRLLTWASIKRIKSGQIEVLFHKVIDRGDRFSNFYYLAPIGSTDKQERHLLNNHQEAVNFLRSEFNSVQLRFVEKGDLQKEYKMLLNKERNKS